MASIYLSTPCITPKHTIRIYEVYNGYVFVLLIFGKPLRMLTASRLQPFKCRHKVIFQLHELPPKSYLPM